MYTISFPEKTLSIFLHCAIVIKKRSARKEFDQFAMGKEYFFRFCAPQQLEELGMTRLSTFRRYLPTYHLYEFGEPVEKITEKTWPDITIHPDVFGFTLCIYHGKGLAWKEILAFLQILHRYDPNLAWKEEDWEADEFQPFHASTFS